MNSINSKNVIVVDDHPDILGLVAYSLKREGYRVTTAGSGIGALWKFWEEKVPSLIILDWMMPSPDGMELCQFLKSSDVFKNVPLILISAKSSKEDIKKGLEMGADAYLPKPFSVSAFLSLVHQLA